MFLKPPREHRSPAQARRRDPVAALSGSRRCASNAIRQRIPTILKALFVLAATLWLAAATVSAEAGSAVAGSSEQELLRLGERMYREGVLPNGGGMQAIVAGDVSVDGRMFACANCHQRSGLGSEEGPVIAWPTNGKELYVPRRRTGAWSPAAEGRGPGAVERWSIPRLYQATDARPAYTDETLARALREGIDPGGRAFNPIMPRYRLSDRDMSILIHYLQNLSTALDPGVDEKTIHLATVVTQGVPEIDRAAMLSVLQAHIDAHNTQTRPHERRARGGPFYKTEKFGAYRRLELAVWELKGPPESWRSQLEAHYQERPVFALLGGITEGSWAPIHQFCEHHRIPSIFPITDRPVISDSDWYTLYFSKGLQQEGEAAARYIRAAGAIRSDARVVQVFREGGDGAVAARAFEETWAGLGSTAPETRSIHADEALTPLSWNKIIGPDAPAVVLLWLDADELSAIGTPAGGLPRPKMVFASWSLLDGRVETVPDAARDIVYLTYPYNLPDEGRTRRSVVKRWLQARGIPVTNFAIQAEMYVLGWVLPAAITHMRSEFFRDYFLEGFDMMRDQDYAVPLYPRLSFGPGQRYASKGCYVVQVTRGAEPQLVRRSEWVIR